MQIETALRKGGCAKGAWLCKREQALSMEPAAGRGRGYAKQGRLWEWHVRTQAGVAKQRGGAMQIAPQLHEGAWLC